MKKLRTYITEHHEMISIIIIGLIALAFILTFRSCPNEKPQVFKMDSANIIAEKEQIIEYYNNWNLQINKELDSLKALKPKVIVRYRTVYDSLLVTDSMCIKSIVTLHDEHDKVDSVNNAIIYDQNINMSNLNSIISSKSEIISYYRFQRSKDSTRLEMVLDSFPSVKRKAFIKGGLIGLGVGLIGGLIVK